MSDKKTALKLLAAIPQGVSPVAAKYITDTAQIYATLELAEQQRVANLIAILALPVPIRAYLSDLGLSGPYVAAQLLAALTAAKNGGDEE